MYASRTSSWFFFTFDIWHFHQKLFIFWSIWYNCKVYIFIKKSYPSVPLKCNFATFFLFLAPLSLVKELNSSKQANNLDRFHHNCHHQYLYWRCKYIAIFVTRVNIQLSESKTASSTAADLVLVQKKLAQVMEMIVLWICCYGERVLELFTQAELSLSFSKSLSIA